MCGSLSLACREPFRFANPERQCHAIVNCFSVNLDVFLKLRRLQRTVLQLFVERYCVQKCV